MPTPAPSARLPPHHPRPPKPVPGAVPRLNIRPGSRRPRVTRQLPADGTILQGRTDEAMPLAVAGEADAGSREVTAARPAANTRSAQVQAPRPARGGGRARSTGCAGPGRRPVVTAGQDRDQLVVVHHPVYRPRRAAGSRRARKLQPLLGPYPAAAAGAAS